MFKPFLLVANTKNVTNPKVIFLAVKQDLYLKGPRDAFGVIAWEDNYPMTYLLFLIQCNKQFVGGSGGRSM